MKVSREQMAENRLRILDSASRLFREQGFEAVTIADVMKDAGLTHGGFYGHFRSKDDLIARALERTLGTSTGTNFDLGVYIDSYLSRQHRDNPGRGCPTAGLAAETRHQAADVRAAMTEGISAQIERMSRELEGLSDGGSRQAAIGCWTSMIGAVILSRAIDDPELSNEVLEQTRGWISTAINRIPDSREESSPVEPLNS
ncbi:TetR/AcrR family transcriptional regulator [Neorhizobium sp. JUb45]|uniref:TetR/AcrR family transcriptional regulator n=1 Tax=Neorhizobium sp. JUb45 TaxID=2485113 RepID=UPI001043B8FD|nr:TetR/AcrR family transcriptional regulator [Neorhizobium sp. JUb45]TCQ99095.1 TetR family transcriptional regulator [Neorhizobium sp. JUb45]